LHDSFLSKYQTMDPRGTLSKEVCRPVIADCSGPVGLNSFETAIVHSIGESAG